MTEHYKHLLSPIRLGKLHLRNRILSTGHQTYLAEKNLPGDNLIAYHETRAKGGVGLIVTEAARFHESSLGHALDLLIHEDAAIPHFARLAEAVHRHGAKVIGQLSHAGRVTRRMQNGMRGIIYAPSPVAEHRNHVVPREMSTFMVEEIIEAVGKGAARYRAAGYDGVELMASHALLFAQFLNPRVNLRTDCFGGSLEGRMRPLSESLAQVRANVGTEMAVGLRISAEEIEANGLEANEVFEICERLVADGLVDYINTTIGSMAGLGGSIHVVPPMEIPPAYVSKKAQSIRDRVSVPVLVAGRINDPAVAERILVSGQADMVAMTRALITDPELPNKTAAGKAETVRACIGCNQSCIGHMHMGYSISCIQNPRTGRELRIPAPAPAEAPLRVVVVGGGPAGMRAAVTAAEDGHKVILVEAGRALGGQALLAQMLPERAEFGGLVTNLLEEIKHHDIDVRLNTMLDRPGIDALKPDAVVVATGSSVLPIDFEGAGKAHVLTAEEVLSGASTGGNVLVADWRCDWVGIGLAMRLASEGRHVRLAVNGICAGQNLPIYVRDFWAGRLHEAGVEVIPYARIFGVDEDTAYLLHSVSKEPIICEGVDTVVVAGARASNTSLEDTLFGMSIPVVTVGDCNTARTAEEAIYEGLVFTREALRTAAASTLVTEVAS